MTFLEELKNAITGAAASNAYIEEAPACVLWTDADKLFLPLLPKLQAEMPELYVLGEYSPDEHRGPAIWLRYMLDGGRTEGKTPVLYLPGVSRSQLRPEDDCPFLLAPLCELIFRGKAWVHENGKDWTPAAFLLSLGVEIQSDAATKEALGRALSKLATSEVEELRGRSPISSSVLDNLLNPDPVDALLGWINSPSSWKKSKSTDEWAAFESRCKSDYKFSPTKDGELKAGELLGEKQGPWVAVWRAFERSPQMYPGVKEVLERVRPKRDSLFFEKASWPQINDEEEGDLRSALLALANNTANQARKRIAELEALHDERRDWLWGKSGDAPLAMALGHLAVLAKGTAKALVGITPQDFAEKWVNEGWKYDAAVLDALTAVDSLLDIEAVKAATRALYRDWLHEGASAFANTVGPTTYSIQSPVTDVEKGTCIVFVDGLRFDVAKKLEAELERIGISSQCQWRFGPLPGVTATAKPLATPLAPSTFAGGAGLDAKFADGRRLTADALRGELRKSGFQILSGVQTGQPGEGPVWVECSNFDSTGHNYGAALAQRIPGEVRDLVSRIRSLLEAGWKDIRVTTDHGWLLLPGGLEKAHLPEHLSEVRKGRCARLKPGSSSEFQTVPWHWDQSVEIAIAPGARCFEEGKEYEHGGLSVQECVLPVLAVTREAETVSDLRLNEPTWKGFRCVVSVQSGEHLPSGYRVDLRTKAADASTSLCDGGKLLTRDSVTLMISDEYRGRAASVVLLDGDDVVKDRISTEVPED